MHPQILLRRHDFLRLKLYALHESKHKLVGWGKCIDVDPIPEPSTVTLALVRLPALAWAMRKRSRPSLS